jgi:retinol dehydrogenase 12
MANRSSPQGHDLEMVTNCVAPYLLTKLLEPIMVKTAATSPQFSVRIIFVVSLMQFFNPATAMAFHADGTPQVLPGDNYMQSRPGDNYMQTKVGGTWLAAEFSNRLGGKGIMSLVSVKENKLHLILGRQLTHV